eukprot:GSChrysophyteH1.ASY1.ANO1.516.1 assembled CDS
MAAKAPSTSLSKNDTIVMDATAQSIKGVLNNLRVQLSALDAEIKADQKGKQDYEKVLKQLETRKKELEDRVEHNIAWAKNFESSMGSSMDSFNNMTKDIGVIYEKAKIGHAAGIKLLEKEFDYHPAFKKPGNTFTGTPYRPI